MSDDLPYLLQHARAQRDKWAEEVVALEARLSTLVGLLRRVEWAGHVPSWYGYEPDHGCFFCGQREYDGHTNGCEWAAALAEEGP